MGASSGCSTLPGWGWKVSAAAGAVAARLGEEGLVAHVDAVEVAQRDALPPASSRASDTEWKTFMARRYTQPRAFALFKPGAVGHRAPPTPWLVPACCPTRSA